MTTNAAIDFRADTLSPPALKNTLANLGSVVGAEALLRAAAFLAAIAIARAYGSMVFGIYATALAYVTVGSMLADNGLQTAAIQQISRSPGEFSPIICRLYATKTLTLMPAIVVFTAVILWWRLPPLTFRIVSLLALRTVLQAYAQLHAAILKAISRMQAIAAVQLLHFILLVAGIVWCYESAREITTMLAVMVAGQVFEVAGSALVLRSNGLRPVRTTLASCWDLVCVATPFGVANTLAAIALRCDVVLLSWIVPPAILGQFAAAQAFLVLGSVASWLFGSVLLPEMARLAQDRDALEYYVRGWIRRLVVALVPAALLTMWAAPTVLPTVFGKAFGADASILVILAAAAPFLFFNSLYLNRAVALDLRSVYVGAYASSFVIGLLLELVLVRVWGAHGVAAACVFREVFLFTFFKVFDRRYQVPA